MGYKVGRAVQLEAKTDSDGSYLKYYTIEGSGGVNHVRFAPGCIIERITITDPAFTDVDVIVNHIERQVAFPNPIITATEISRLNAGTADPIGMAIDQLDFLCGSLGEYDDLLAGVSYIRLEILNLPATAILSFRYYRHPTE